MPEGREIYTKYKECRTKKQKRKKRKRGQKEERKGEKKNHTAQWTKITGKEDARFLKVGAFKVKTGHVHITNTNLLEVSFHFGEKVWFIKLKLFS